MVPDVCDLRPGDGMARGRGAQPRDTLNDVAIHGQARATEGTRGVYERSPKLHRARGSRNRVGTP